MTFDRRTGLFLGLGSLLLSQLSPLEVLARGHKPKTRIYPEQPPTHHLRNKLTKNSLTVYYLTHSWALYENDKRDIVHFFRDHENASFLVEGYADARGSEAFNLALGEKRAKGIAELLRGLKSLVPLTTASYGETKPVLKGDTKKDYQKNRRVVLVANKDPYTRSLDLTPGDVYLIDASSSMQPVWNKVKIGTYPYPKTSEVYTFNDCTGLRLRQTPRQVSLNSDNPVPMCGTPLWSSLVEVIGLMEKGKRLTVLTDGDDTYGKNTPNEVIQIATKKGIKISAVGVGISPYTKKSLIDIAQKTSGNFYISN